MIATVVVVGMVCHIQWEINWSLPQGVSPRVHHAWSTVRTAPTQHESGCTRHYVAACVYCSTCSSSIRVGVSPCVSCCVCRLCWLVLEVDGRGLENKRPLADHLPQNLSTKGWSCLPVGRHTTLSCQFLRIGRETLAFRWLHMLSRHTFVFSRWRLTFIIFDLTPPIACVLLPSPSLNWLHNTDCDSVRWICLHGPPCTPESDKWVCMFLCLWPYASVQEWFFVFICLYFDHVK